DRPVARAGPNQNAHPGVDRDDLLVELHAGVRPALQEVVGLGKPAVVVKASVGGDLGNVDRRGIVGEVGKGTPRRTARTGNSRQLGEVDQFIVASFGGHRWSVRMIEEAARDQCSRNATVVGQPAAPAEGVPLPKALLVKYLQCWRRSETPGARQEST